MSSRLGGREPLKVLVQVLELLVVLQVVVLLLLQPLLRNERRLGRGLRSQAVGRLQSPERSSSRRWWWVELHRCRKRA